MKNLFSCLFLLLGIYIMIACSNENNNHTNKDDTAFQDTIAVYYYNLQANGRFDEYVESMQSCQGTTPDYKQRIIKMLQQHQKEILKVKKGVSHVQAVRTEMHNHNKMANVFLNVTYNDSSREEIIFPLVFDNGQWLIQ